VILYDFFNIFAFSILACFDSFRLIRLVSLSQRKEQRRNREDSQNKTKYLDDLTVTGKYHADHVLVLGDPREGESLATPASFLVAGQRYAHDCYEPC
jgi:hypothetical protein